MNYRLLALMLVTLFVAGCAVKPEPLSGLETSEKSNKILEQMTNQADDIDNEIDLNEAIARAIKHNRERRLQILETILARGQVSLEEFDMLPQLTASAGFNERNRYGATASTSFTDDTPDPLGANPSYSVSQDKSSVSASISYSWNILDFGLSYVRANQQADRFLVSRERERKVIHRITEDVRNAYFRALTAERLLGQIDPLAIQAEEALNKSERIERLRAQSPMDALNYQRELLEVLRTLQGLKAEFDAAKTELASLMGLRPGTDYTLAEVYDFDYRVPDVAIGIETMEQLALVYRPEVLETHYQERISSQEARAALLTMLPGISLSTGVYYDDNAYLRYNDWSNAGAQISWNLFNVFKGRTLRRMADVQEEYAREQALATAAAVLTQVHMASIRYTEAHRSYQIAERYFEVTSRIREQVRAERATDNVGELDVIRESINFLLASLRRDLAYAELRNSYGQVFSSMGLDIVEPDSTRQPLPQLTERVTRRLHNWEQGLLPPIETGAP